MDTRSLQKKEDRNEKADRLAREGSDLKQLSDGLSYQEAKHKIKSLMKERWKTIHPHHNTQDGLLYIRWIGRVTQPYSGFGLATTD
ncbi:hypothetical protein ElyMa_004899100 [Elysia marginata]|uniref:RNase H type-1 domain-containing protein n=1 Tax=Elysia marginata TaxID=1093978 RepID=A0AAV4IU90_9GAST|nr:hypothetical protein ElyMa_004899100 [Elysia marginata]